MKRADSVGKPLTEEGRSNYDKIFRKKGRFALLERHDRKGTKLIPVPLNQSEEFDDTGATRKWLHPYLGSEYHLVDFVTH